MILLHTCNMTSVQDDEMDTGNPSARCNKNEYTDLSCSVFVFVGLLREHGHYQEGTSTRMVNNGNKQRLNSFSPLLVDLVKDRTSDSHKVKRFFLSFALFLLELIELSFGCCFPPAPTIMSTSSSNKPDIPLLYTTEEIERVIRHKDFSIDLIQGIQDGFVALEKGDFFACPIQTMGLPPYPFVDTEGYSAQTCVKSGYFKGQDYYVIKVASGGYPMPTNSGLMQVYSQKTGKLEALLLDDGILTEIRTAAVGALAAKLLGPKHIESIGIVGTGIQARYQLRMLPTVTDCRKVLVWGRTPSKAQVFCQEMSKEGWDVLIVEQIDELLMKCDLLVTTTCSREPILGKNLAPLLSRSRQGLHITCIGADAPGKIELVPELVAKADLLVADTTQQTLERGEFRKAIQDGHVSRECIVSLGKLVEQLTLQRTGEPDPRLTIFDSSGVALQDCVVSQMIYDALRKS